MNLNTNLSVQQLCRMLSVGSLPHEDEAVFWSGAARGIRARATLSREGHDYQFVVYEDRWEAPCISLTLRERGGFITAAPEQVDSLLAFAEAISGLEMVD